MCGIAGIVGPGDSQTDVAAMTELLRHRGPDDGGTWQEPGVCLGHRRLAIIDLSAAGHQPMCFGRYTIVYNGEIYNFRELRKELAGPFRSDSDTEVLLHLYAEQGPSCLEELVGMFAFAIWDAEKRELFLARDRLGIKPLFLLERPGLLAFASEVKALSVQTAKATQDIAGQIQAVQNSSRSAVDAIQRITKRMKDINEHTAAIAASVGQQSAVTNEISQNVTSAAKGAQVVTAVLDQVANSVAKTSDSAGTVSAASRSVQDAAHALAVRIEDFLKKVAA
jgi:asparagine synthase (glutamine-hydrolysing)